MRRVRIAVADVGVGRWVIVVRRREGGARVRARENMIAGFERLVFVGFWLLEACVDCMVVVDRVGISRR